MYIHNESNIKFKIRADLNKWAIERDFELAAIELKCPVNIIVVTLYRAPEPSKFSSFVTKLINFIEYACNENKQTMICGDINVNVFDKVSYATLVEALMTVNGKLLMDEPTRIAKYSSGVSSTALIILSLHLIKYILSVLVIDLS
jgi:exonuclease III